MKIAKIALKIILSLIILGIITAAAGYFYIKKDLPDVDKLKYVELAQPMQIYTKDGLLMGEVGSEKRIPLTLDQVPKDLINAVLATEDSRFYSHLGLDPIGILRALKNVIIEGRASQGASTITQQVARNFFLSPEKTLIRKIREAVLAIEIENSLSKDEILTLYLNKIYLGYHSYGVAAAAKTYFAKDVKDLNLSEIAVIAGLPKAPSNINPLRSVKRATERRNIVLGRMLDEKYIDQQQYNDAVNSKVVTNYQGSDVQFRADFIAEMVRIEMVRRYGEKDAYTKGFKVYTTILSNKQQFAQKSVMDNLENYDLRHGYRGGLPLWSKNQTPWSEAKMQSYLQNIPTVDGLITMVATDKTDKYIEFMNEDGNKIQLANKNIVFAKRNVKNKIKFGDVVYFKLDDKKQLVLSQIPAVNGALVSINSQNGAIEALVGGYSYTLSKFNRATQSSAQVGSTIKPFIYASALDKGLTMSSLINDAPIRMRISGMPDWRPKNSPNRYDGLLRLRAGLGMSKNMVTIRVADMVGIDYVADFIARFGFDRSQYSATQSLSLGSASFTPLEMARGYSTFVNGGFLINPYLIEKIIDSNDNEEFIANPEVACSECEYIPPIYDEQQRLSILQQKEIVSDNIIDDQIDANALNSENGETDFGVEEQPEIKDKIVETYLMAQNQKDSTETKFAPRVIYSDIAFLTKRLMKGVIYGDGSNTWYGTGSRIARVIKRPDVGGKTGTTNRSISTWFAGFGADIVTVSYVGFDNPKPLGRGESGAKTAMPAWLDYMQYVLKGIKPKPEYIPPSLVKVSIDPATGLQTKDGGIDEYFIKGTVPRALIEEQGLKIHSSDSPDKPSIDLF